MTLKSITHSFFLIAAMSFAPNSILAQEIYGTLRHMESGRPAAGVIVTVSLTSNDSTVARTITSSGGSYSLKTLAAPVVVRVLRVGQQPFELARITTLSDTRHVIDGELPNIPVQLNIISTRAQSRCKADPINSSLAAQLFNQARTALWTSRLTSSDKAYVKSRFQVIEQQFDTRERPQGKPLVSQDSASTLSPFSSIDVDFLLNNGFQIIGDDNSVVYHAPDADVLTSDRFLTDYCLKLSEDSLSHPAWVGVSFSPARTRSDIVQTRGTVWLERNTQELKRIEYGYAGIAPALARSTPGGIVEYTRLDNGVWFVHHWSVRMPRITNFTRRTTSGNMLGHVAINGVQITTGSVIDLFQNDQLIFTSGNEEATVSAGEMASSLVAYRDSSVCQEGSTSISGQVLDSAGRPEIGYLVRAHWLVRVETGWKDADYEARESFTHTDNNGNFLICDIPRTTRISLQAGEGDTDRTTINLRSNAEAARVILRSSRPQ